MAAGTASSKGGAVAPKKRTAVVKKDRRDDLSRLLADKWWAVGLRAIMGILFGLICLLNPTLALNVFIILFAAYMLVDGIFAIASGIRAATSGGHWALLILQGLVSIAAAAVAMIWPAMTLVALVWIIAIWAIISGALMLAAAFALHIDYGRWWLALGGIASLVFGILLVIQPFIGAVVLTLWIGAYALVFGIFLLVLAFQLFWRKEELVEAATRGKKA
ncbi:HdeD family acid-resistance protein [Methyloceanibacter sp.]|uniref:HdeD family acid-resistance protein n=1 Tax=Methyloceanibacter sp. TaxID=1965321 RepID=UPI00347FC7EC